ncbi:MAG: hotdog fold thioesterase [Saprospiraceae bacterium]
MEKNEQIIAKKIVEELMLGRDAFSKLLDIQLVEVKPGFCTVQCVVSNQMLNGFYIAHGGITYSLSDSALAFASNAHNIKAVSIETSISHLKKVVKGDILTATCVEKNLSNKFGVYEVTVTNQADQPVALFKGTVFRTGEKWV